jgi:dCMP deaminase
MKFALLAAERSTCCRMKTGAVIVKDGRIVCMGYNGVGSGQIHCQDYWYNKYQELKTNEEITSWESFKLNENFLRQHHEWAIINEIHGEHNAILFACKHGIVTDKTVMYSLYSPCTQCSKAIIQSGIKKIYYNKIYTNDVNGLNLLTQHKIEHEQINI